MPIRLLSFQRLAGNSDAYGMDPVARLTLYSSIVGSSMIALEDLDKKV